jgi:Ca-activated chloride channel homolog
MERGPRNLRGWLVAASLCFQLLPAADLFLHGKVTMEDGSPPPKPVTIERPCQDSEIASFVATTNVKGEFIWKLTLQDVDLTTFNRSCVLRASLKGYDSTTIEYSDWNLFQDPNLKPIVLVKHGGSPSFNVFNEAQAPRQAFKTWARAGKAAQAGNWAEAEKQIRASLQAYPRFAQGWHALGIIYGNEQKIDQAREAQLKAVELNPKLLAAYLMLARLDIEAKDWEGAKKAADRLIQDDTRRKYPEAYVHQAIARWQLKDQDGAEASVKEAIRLDRKHDLPRAEYVLGMILESKRDFEGARDHMQRYLALEPKASDQASVRSRMEHLGTTAATDIATELQQVAAQLQLAPSTEAWVPGGIKALAALAGVTPTTGPVTSQDFFTEFCRALVREVSPGLARGVPEYHRRLETFMESIAELGHSGERKDDKTVITLSLAGEEPRKSAARILNLLGWRLTDSGVEPGDQPADGLRQRIPSLLGIDEIDMQHALESGRVFQFEVPSENARLIGGEAWTQAIVGGPSRAGGLAEAFVKDPRLAKAYAGLGAMGADTAAAVVTGVGLRALVDKYADVLARYSDAFALSKDGASVPGDEEAWKKLAGVSPRAAPAFFRALLERDEGSLAAFDQVLSHADAAHQRFFTGTAARAERFYAWYRDSGEPRWSLTVAFDRWRSALLQKLPLDDAGNVRFPGGRQAWTDARGADVDALLKFASLEALVPVARVEQERKAPLDEVSARLLAQHYAQWRPLFPYFEKLPGLGRAEFEAMVAFTQSVSGYARAQQSIVLGEWYSLVELIERGVLAGSLGPEESAQAFRNVCAGLAAQDHSARAVAALREMSSRNKSDSRDVRESVATGLLRLTPERRAGFDRVLELLSVPRLDPPGDASRTAAALSGLVYAATLDPDGLLVNEDPRLLSKHQFAGAPEDLFSQAKLVASNQPPGSYLSGGFVNIDDVARKLARGGRLVSRGEAAPVATAAAGQAEILSNEATFHADGRLVEVYATVTDSRGRYVDDLTQDQFTIMEQGTPRAAAGFESRSAEVSVALLLDTTGSMQAALPALKNAALKLIGDLRASDWVAVYSFNNTVSELQPFSTDKNAAKRAVLRTEPFGETALYDALARVNRDLSGRSGKKVIVVFTDGDDNASTITAQAAIQRAKAAGVPVYTVAQGAALTNPEFLKQLSGVSQATGGAAYAIHNPGEIRGVFESISQDLLHTYFFAFQPAPAENHEYRRIEVTIRGSKQYKVRAREGFYPE